MIHLTLPSNASLKKFPDNVVAEYTTALATPLSLQGEWEVGLSEISFPHSFYGAVIKIAGSESGAHIPLISVTNGKNPTLVLSIPPGLYKDTESFMDAFGKANSDRFKVLRFGTGGYALKFDKGFATPNLRGDLHTSYISDSDDAQRPFSFFREFSLSEEGGRYISVDQIIFYPSGGRAIVILRLKKLERESLYDFINVHCDIIRPSIQGGSLKQIIRRVPVRGVLRDDSLSQTVIFPRVFYFPLIRMPITTVRIGLKDSHGLRIPFRAGAASVTLSFRKKVGSL